MKARLAAILLVVGVVLATSGCAGGLQGAIQAAQVFETGMQAAENVAETTWPSILPLIPAASQPQATKDYQDAIAGLTLAIQEDADAIDAAQTLSSGTPDFTKVEQDVADALAKVLGIFSQWQGAKPPPGVAHLKAMHVHMTERIAREKAAHAKS